MAEIRPIFDAAARRLRALAGPGPPGFLDQIRKVVLLQSAPRSGSSAVASALCGFPELLHLQGEITPLLTAAGLTTPWNGADSDALDSCSPSAARVFGSQLAFDVAAAAGSLDDPAVRTRFAQALCWRLTAQWPEERFDLAEIGDTVERSLRKVSELDGHGAFGSARLHVLLLRELRRRHPSVSPWYYDVQAELVRRICPDLPMASGPSSRCVIEEPPFLTIRPTRELEDGEPARKELLIKTPANAFRLPFLRKVFPNAAMRVVHLTRDAAPSIAGLLDGWLYRGFHSHWLPGELHMPGYVDQVGEEERQWWKFDLPPGWRDWTSRPLVEVCAWQWERVHREILATTYELACPSIRIRFEDLFAPDGTGERTAIWLAEWLGLEDPPAFARRLRRLPLIMATRRRQDRRGHAFAREIDRVTAARSVAQVRKELGYGC